MTGGKECGMRNAECGTERKTRGVGAARRPPWLGPHAALTACSSATMAGSSAKPAGHAPISRRFVHAIRDSPEESQHEKSPCRDI